ncbi:MAG: hypothetical protein KBC16_00745 [Candidatus Pacebacteria bacterium]|nr:hypothetical protein [Candidatus Paceibacterota bacterium]
MTPNFDSLHAHALTGAGLTQEQAHVYELLLKRGPRQAGQLPRTLGLSRPYVYKLLSELEGLGLVTKEEPPGKPAQFVPAHPFAIQELIRKRQSELSVTDQTIKAVMSSLISDYSTSSRTPGVRIIPGIEGIQELYQDILQEGKPVSLLRSVRDDDTPELLELVLEQIKKQVKRGITARILSPLPTDISLPALYERDKERLTARKTIDRERFTLPAQIIMYGDKTGITAYQETHMTTIIENTAITATFRAVFEILWTSVGVDPYDTNTKA